MDFFIRLNNARGFDVESLALCLQGAFDANCTSNLIRVNEGNINIFFDNGFFLNESEMVTENEKSTPSERSSKVGAMVWFESEQSQKCAFSIIEENLTFLQPELPRFEDERNEKTLLESDINEIYSTNRTKSLTRITHQSKRHLDLIRKEGKPYTKQTFFSYQ